MSMKKYNREQTAFYDKLQTKMKQDKKLALEHWEFIEKWLEMVYIDSFLHGYKHGKEDFKK